MKVITVNRLQMVSGINLSKKDINCSFPEPEQLVEEDDKPCDQWRGPKETRKNPGGWDCFIYARYCDGITCKEKCDYYNKKGCFKKCYKN